MTGQTVKRELGFLSLAFTSMSLKDFPLLYEMSWFCIKEDRLFDEPFAFSTESIFLWLIFQA